MTTPSAANNLMVASAMQEDSGSPFCSVKPISTHCSCRPSPPSSTVARLAANTLLKGAFHRSLYCDFHQCSAGPQAMSQRRFRTEWLYSNIGCRSIIQISYSPRDWPSLRHPASALPPTRLAVLIRNKTRAAAPVTIPCHCSTSCRMRPSRNPLKSARVQKAGDIGSYPLAGHR